MSATVESSLRVEVAGDLAHAALVRCKGRLRPLPAFPDSPYVLAGDQIVWLGGEGGCWHPRRILLAAPCPARPCGQLQLSVEGARVWQAPALPRFGRAQLAASCTRIRAHLPELGAPAGFGALLAGAPLGFPLDLAGARVARLGDALARDDAAAFESAALPLLGLGLGLTPSGDDLVGACLFALRLRTDSGAWQGVAARLASAALERSNAISAALFGDLARGAAYAPLHELAAAMNGSVDKQLTAACALTAIGHSSGWDMLTGFMLGAAGPAAAIGWKPAPDKAFQPIVDANFASSSR